jgi:hypothetical protein
MKAFNELFQARLVAYFEHMLNLMTTEAFLEERNA